MIKKIGLVIFLCLMIMNMNYGEIKVVDTVNLTSGINGNRPTALCVLGTKIYVANEGSANVSIIDTANNNAVSTINVGDRPVDLCVLGTKVYVANNYSNNVSIIDTANNNAVSTVAVRKYPVALCVLGTKVYVANELSNSVSIIDTGNNNLVSTVNVGNQPVALCVLGTNVYVVNWDSDSVSIINTENNNFVTNIKVGNIPRALCVLGTKVYVANYDSGSISVLEEDKNSIDLFSTNRQKSKISSYPNPFNPECYIAIEAVSGQLSAVSKIKIYNILGQVVRELNVSNGSNSVYWDGRDNFGKELSSGMYFYETIVNNKVQNYRKMLMLK